MHWTDNGFAVKGSGMSTRLRPEIGLWYSHRDKGQMFQVVAIDEDDGVIEIQDVDGDVDEIDLDGWHTLLLARAEPPEDATGPADEADADETRDSADFDSPVRHWRGPLDELPAQPQEAIEVDDYDEDVAGR